MRFIEKFGAVDALMCLVTRHAACYGVKSLGARVIEKIAAWIGQRLVAEQLDFGHVTYATSIRERAYRAAERAMDKLPGQDWAKKLSVSFGIDMWLITRKFFFDEYYRKFEFFELALRYVEETPSAAPLLLIADFADPLDDTDLTQRLDAQFRTRHRRNTSPIGLLTILLLPLFVEFYYRRNGQSGNLSFDNRVVCEVDGAATFEMFSTLFAGMPTKPPVFVCEPRNLERLTGQPVHALHLDALGHKWLRRAVWQFLAASLAYTCAIGFYGTRLFRLFYLVMQGRAQTIGGSGNLYCTYEHLITYKSVRNAFLEHHGNRSLFMPLNAYVTPQYFHSEILINYTLMCSAGAHIEMLYRQKRGLIKHYLPTGSYASHRRGAMFGDQAARVTSLQALKGASICVVVLSPGICDPTYAHELKLMAFTRELSKLSNVKVILRLKPVEPEVKYANFYRDQIGCCENVTVTAGEYDLFDFLQVGDLFLTSISNSAFDLAQAGAQVMFIDYLHDPKIQLPLCLVPEVLVSEAAALDVVQRWLNDEDNAREQWRELMSRFSGYIAYRHESIEAYRDNFLQQITPFLPK